jgi:zinc protease
MSSHVHDIPGPDSITRTVLPNGITVIVYENHSAQSVVIAGSLKAGSLYESAEDNGLSSLTASALMLGTENRDFDAINSSLEDIGADLDIHAGAHRVGFGGKALAEDLPVLIDVLADAVRRPVFPANQIERRRGETLTWLQYRQQDTRWQASRTFRETLYPPSHPYHYSVRGTLESLPKLTVDALRTFHQAHYGPSGMLMTIVGAVRAEEAIDVVSQWLGDWGNPDQPEEPPLPELPVFEKTIRAGVNVPGKTQSDLILGVAGPSRSDDDFEAARLANSVLGQFGMMGRIGDQVREKAGLAYYAYSRLSGGFGPGAWSVAAGVNPANVDQALELSIAEVRRMRDELVSEEDLADNQSYFTGRLPLQLESNEGIAGTLLSMETHDLGMDYLRRYRDIVYGLTRDDIRKAVQRYWDMDRLVVSVAGPGVTS